MLIPPYQKFLKDAVQQRTREAQGMVVLTRECSAIIQRKVISDKKGRSGEFHFALHVGTPIFQKQPLRPRIICQPHAFVRSKETGISQVSSLRNLTSLGR
ncbi:unnamed protein product [Microthlaspi erraticum]|uniref:Uncharacterized protein n=1 Tax=Microthlaspi erraticum TaxID=1685480 RepID=A0A6D2J6R6_9BRAS|nr:unnamed protein product [Microthlaspi erraticum]